MEIPISNLRNCVDISANKKYEMQERHNALEKVILYQLQNAKTSILDGEVGNHKVHAGQIVAIHREVNIILANKPPDKLEKEAITNLFGSNITGDLDKLVLQPFNATLGNSNVGEHEEANMFIQWSEYALIRIDVYYYRWNFSSNEIIEGVEGVTGFIVIKRVVNLLITDPQILISTILNQIGMIKNQKTSTEMLNKAFSSFDKICATANRLELFIPRLQLELICSKSLYCCNMLHVYANMATEKKQTQSKNKKQRRRNQRKPRKTKKQIRNEKRQKSQSKKQSN